MVFVCLCVFASVYISIHVPLYLKPRGRVRAPGLYVDTSTRLQVRVGAAELDIYI